MAMIMHSIIETQGMAILFRLLCYHGPSVEVHGATFDQLPTTRLSTPLHLTSAPPAQGAPTDFFF